MAKVTLAGEHHYDRRGVRRVDDLLVAHRTARLHDRGDAGTRQGLESVGKGKEGVLRRGRAAREVTGLGGGDARRHDTRLLSGPDADGDAVAGDHDGVGRRSGAHAPRHGEVLQLLLGRCGDRYAFPIGDRHKQFVGVLHQRRITEGSDRESERFG